MKTRIPIEIKQKGFSKERYTYGGIWSCIHIIVYPYIGKRKMGVAESRKKVGEGEAYI